MTIVNQLDLETLVLGRGSHSQNSNNEMCIMEAVAYVAGEVWSDAPECASPTIAAIMRRWNDDLDDDGRQALKPYIFRLVGSRGSPEIEAKRQWMATDWLLHQWLPLWLRTAGMEDQALACEAIPPISSYSEWLTADNTEIAHWMADNGHGLFVEGVPEADDWRNRYWPDSHEPDNQGQRLTDEEVDDLTQGNYEEALANGEQWAEEAYEPYMGPCTNA